MFGPKRSSLERLSRTQDPSKGQFNFFETPFALRQVTGRQQVYENPCECVYCVLRWVCVALRLGGGMHMHMFWHAPKLTQPSHRSPGSAMSAESSVGYVTYKAAKERQPW